VLVRAAKVVDLEPCLKKPVEDSACHPYSTRGSMSEVQSLSSFQSESCDDNGEKRTANPILCLFLLSSRSPSHSRRLWIELYLFYQRFAVAYSKA